MKENVYTYKRPDEGELYERANVHCDNGDYAAALSSLLYEAERDPSNADIHAHVADIYTELGLYENAVREWFRYLARSRKKYYADGYNGLGANFYLLGDKVLAGYYFNKQMAENYDGELVYQDIFEDYIDEMTETLRSEFHIVKDDEDEKLLETAEDLIDEEKYKRALGTLKKIDKNGKSYPRAAACMAKASYRLSQYADAAVYACDAVHGGENDPETYVYALKSLRELGMDGEFYKLYAEFLKEDYEERSDVYRRLAAACDFGFIKDAEKLADDILAREPNDANACFVKGLAEYGLGDKNRAEVLLKKAYLLSTNPVAKYYAEKAGERSEDFFLISFMLPDWEAKERMDIVKDIYEGKASPDDFSEKRLKDIAEWIFGGDNEALHILMGIILVLRSDNVSFREIILDQLVSYNLSDDVKHRFLTMLCERGYSETVSVVYDGIFKKIKIPSSDFDGKTGFLFGEALAFAFGRLTLVWDNSFEKLRKGAIALKNDLEGSGYNFGGQPAVTSLACAVYKYSGMKCLGEEDDKFLCGFFSADEKTVSEILSAAHTNVGYGVQGERKSRKKDREKK